MSGSLVPSLGANVTTLVPVHHTKLHNIYDCTTSCIPSILSNWRPIYAIRAVAGSCMVHTEESKCVCILSRQHCSITPCIHVYMHVLAHPCRWSLVISLWRRLLG